jgi:tRNA-dihydrouridine synthase
LTKTIRYFKLHPLKTHKSIIYLNWYKIYKLVNNKQHLTVWGLNKIKTYQKTIDRLSKKI